MRERSNSFSKFGSALERSLRNYEYEANPEKLRNLLHKSQIKLQVYGKQQKKMQSFDSVSARENLNSFQLSHTKECCLKNYEDKSLLRAKSNNPLPIRKQQDRRLSKLIVEKPKYQILTPTCPHYISSDNSHIMTTKDLQNARKTFHSLNFDKQTNRSSLNNQLLLTRNNIQSSSNGYNQQLKNLDKTINKSEQIGSNLSLRKTKSIHAFSSYLPRDFLSNFTYAPPVSGAQAYKIGQQKYRENWKIVKGVQFQKQAKKYLNRYDSNCEPWYTKLSYKIKEETIKGNNSIKFGQQTNREDNFVHSKYPMRQSMCQK